jgi:hypothetical protein
MNPVQVCSVCAKICLDIFKSPPAWGLQAAGKAKKHRKSLKNCEEPALTAATLESDPLEDRRASNDEASTSYNLQPRITSSNAYMLLYRQKQDVEIGPVQLPPR